VDEQVDRLRRATVALTVVVGVIGALFLTLFSAFGAPILGLVIAGLLAGLVIVPAWRSFRRMRADARRYLQELRAEQSRGLRPEES
jgi:hypothetical protein